MKGHSWEPWISVSSYFISLKSKTLNGDKATSFQYVQYKQLHSWRNIRLFMEGVQEIGNQTLHAKLQNDSNEKCG